MLRVYKKKHWSSSQNKREVCNKNKITIKYKFLNINILL